MASAFVIHHVPLQMPVRTRRKASVGRFSAAKLRTYFSREKRFTDSPHVECRPLTIQAGPVFSRTGPVSAKAAGAVAKTILFSDKKCTTTCIYIKCRSAWWHHSRRLRLCGIPSREDIDIISRGRHALRYVEDPLLAGWGRVDPCPDGTVAALGYTSMANA